VNYEHLVAASLEIDPELHPNDGVRFSGGAADYGRHPAPADIPGE
jgi:hypothetical protein